MSYLSSAVTISIPVYDMEWLSQMTYKDTKLFLKKCLHKIGDALESNFRKAEIGF